MSDVVGRITQLTPCDSKATVDNYVPCSLEELGFADYDKYYAKVMDRECGLVEFENKYGVFMVSPAIKVEALKAKIAAWVEKQDKDIFGQRVSVFRTLHDVVYLELDDGLPGWVAEIGHYGYEGFDTAAFGDAEDWFLLTADGPTELEALQGLDEKLRKLDDYE